MHPRTQMSTAPRRFDNCRVDNRRVVNRLVKLEEIECRIMVAPFLEGLSLDPRPDLCWIRLDGLAMKPQTLPPRPSVLKLVLKCLFHPPWIECSATRSDLSDRIRIWLLFLHPASTFRNWTAFPHAGFRVAQNHLGFGRKSLLNRLSETQPAQRSPGLQQLTKHRFETDVPTGFERLRRRIGS